MHTYVYDAEDRLYSIDGSTCYAYDAEGDRIARTNCNVVNSGSGMTSGIEAEFLYDPNHRLMTEIALSEQITRANIYAGGEFLAEDSPDPFLTNTVVASQLRVTDQVGSLRALMDTGNPKNLWSGAWSSFPYGDGATPGDGADSGDNPGGMLFTGKKRDAESGLDYFGARYYSSAMGRFSSPDHPFVDQHPGDPQSWNLYAYARNNPLINLDPSGLGCVTDLGQGSDTNHESVELNNSIGSDDCADQNGTWVPGDVNKDDVGVYRGSDGSINFQATTNTGGNVYYSSFVSGAQTDSNGVGAGASIAHASADWLSGQMVGGSLDQMMSFAANRMQPRGGGGLMALLAGSGFSPDAPDNWAGPGGMGTPQGQGDWAAMVHDYNFFTNNITIGTYFNPFVSRATAKALIQSDNYLVGHAGGAQSVKMGMLFGVVNAFQWLTHPF